MTLSDLAPTGQETLTPAQSAQFADTPPALECLANITNPKTCRTYKVNVEEFSGFVGLKAPWELRTVM